MCCFAIVEMSEVANQPESLPTSMEEAATRQYLHAVLATASKADTHTLPKCWEPFGAQLRGTNTHMELDIIGAGFAPDSPGVRPF